MAETTGGERRPGGAGSIQWRGGRPYAVCRDALTGKQTWTGFDTEEEADAFRTQWAADRKAARVAAKASRPERSARAPQRRARSSSDPWTFGQLLTDWDDRHRDGVQESTMRDYGPGLNDLRQALGGVLARSLTDEHFEAYKRAKLDGVDVGGGEDPVRRLSAATVNKRLDLAHRVIAEAVRRGAMDGPNPVEGVVRPRDPERVRIAHGPPSTAPRNAARPRATRWRTTCSEQPTPSAIEPCGSSATTRRSTASRWAAGNSMSAARRASAPLPSILARPSSSSRSGACRAAGAPCRRRVERPLAGDRPRLGDDAGRRVRPVALRLGERNAR